jgi:hypothetical protein
MSDEKQKRKPWMKSIQGWSWSITVVWMTIANIWKPFGLYGFVCMFTPIILALAGYGKMSCARICPRGSFIARVTKKISIGLKRPKFTFTKRFHWLLWGVMMGTFAVLMVWAVPQGVTVIGGTVLLFMESATGLALICGILFTPRMWCTICPMGFTAGNLTKLIAGKKKQTHEREYSYENHRH